METTENALLVGGPRDGTTAETDGSGLLELTIEGMIHRYIRTGKEREQDGQRRHVYNYDGMVSPDGGESGAETEPQRMASPEAKSHR